MVEYKTPGEIDAMHAAGQVLARILAAVRDQAAPGVRLAELDATARDVLVQDRATSPFLGYQPAFADSPYPAVLCASVNDAALHDIPGRRRLRDGDLHTVAITADGPVVLTAPA
jgi:methionyl aminopeptidase